MHAEARSFIAKHLPAGTRTVLDLGSHAAGEGHVTDVLGEIESYVGMDIAAGQGVSIIGDVCQPLPYRADFDLVICAEVLEHVHNPVVPLLNAYFALKPGGTLLVTAASPEREPHSCLRPGPPLANEWYRGIHPDHLETVLGWVDFAEYEVSADEGHHDVYARCVR